jgi:hypothetical protein
MLAASGPDQYVPVLNMGLNTPQTLQTTPMSILQESMSTILVEESFVPV